MKRRARLPLLRHLEPVCYVIDTSAWVNIDNRLDAEDVWQLIIRLIAESRIVACARVLDELRDNPLYLKRLKPYEKALQAGERASDDPEYLAMLGRITYEHPAMCKASGVKTQADGYVVALAELDHYTVVADETTAKRPNRKIPGVCQQRGINCISLDQFVSDNAALGAAAAN
jgi:hypothetical protein